MSSTFAVTPFFKITLNDFQSTDELDQSIHFDSVLFYLNPSCHSLILLSLQTSGFLCISGNTTKSGTCYMWHKHCFITDRCIYILMIDFPATCRH